MAPQNMTRSSGHGTLKYTTLVYYFELWQLKTQQVQGEAFSELSIFA